MNSSIAMVLRSLSVIDLKNIPEADIELSEGVNCFVGRNGAGKTNLLDAVHYLSFCKSILNPIDSQNIREGRPFFFIQGGFEDETDRYELTCSMERNKKKRFKKDQREYDRLADHIGRFPIVMIAPFDLDLVREGSDKRRRFMDGIISQYDPQYLRDLIRYNRALSHRNALLKNIQKKGQRSSEELEIWEEQMSETGERIRTARGRFVDDLIPVFQKIHAHITEEEEEAQLEYRRSGEGGLQQELQQEREKDLLLGYSSTGPHKEDLRFMIGGSALKKFGSQGQQKSFVMAIKMAQYRFIHKALNVRPILLLDDLFDKLDNERMERSLDLVAGEDFGQILITDTDKERLEHAMESIGGEGRFFRVEAGKVGPWNMETTNAP